MPAQPSWHARAAQIRRDLDRLAVPVLDRAAVEQLFGIERRTAQRLLRTLDGHVSSQVAVVTRASVIAMLDRLLAGKPVPAEAARKERLADALASLAQEAIPRTTAIEAVPAPPPGDGWPEGVAVSAPVAASGSGPESGSESALGSLQIAFSTPEELLGRILALTEQAAEDYAGFVQRLKAASGDDSGDLP